MDNRIATRHTRRKKARWIKEASPSATVQRRKKPRDVEFCPLNAVKSKVRSNAPMPGCPKSPDERKRMGAHTHIYYRNMDFAKIETLKEKRMWAEMLRNLPLGENTVKFSDVKYIKSCKAIGYDLNTDKAGRRYAFNVDKDNLVATITVEETKTKEEE